MQQPIDSLVAEIIGQFDAELAEDWSERAAIMEFDAGLERAHAEALALVDLLRRYPNALSGVTLLEVEWQGATEWMLTTNIATARQHISTTGGIEVGRPDLAYVLDRQYSGMSRLSMV